MIVKKISANPTLEFRGKLPAETKRAIKAFVKEYLKPKDKKPKKPKLRPDIRSNAVAALSRGLGGGEILLSVSLIDILQNGVHDSRALFRAINLGIGSMAVAISRYIKDMNTTAQAEFDAIRFARRLKRKFKNKDECLYGVERFMREKSGIGYKILSLFSSRRARKILDEMDFTASA